LKIRIELLKIRTGEVAQGRLPGSYFEKTRFEDLVGLYWINFEKQGKRDRERAVGITKHLNRVFAGMRAFDISQSTIQKYEKLRRDEGVKKANINRELSVLRAMFKLGIENKKVSADRAPVIKLYAREEPRQGFVNKEECDRLIEHSPDWLKLVIRFAFQTAWRKEEILGLKWEYVNMNERMTTLPSRESKSGEPRPIYADDVIYEML